MRGQGKATPEDIVEVVVSERHEGHSFRAGSIRFVFPVQRLYQMLPTPREIAVRFSDGTDQEAANGPNVSIERARGGGPHRLVVAITSVITFAVLG